MLFIGVARDSSGQVLFLYGFEDSNIDDDIRSKVQSDTVKVPLTEEETKEYFELCREKLQLETQTREVLAKIRRQQNTILAQTQRIIDTNVKTTT